MRKVGEMGISEYPVYLSPFLEAGGKELIETKLRYVSRDVLRERGRWR